MGGPQYEILALRYATMQERPASANFLFPDDHAANMPIDYYVWAIRGEGRVIVVDTGFGMAGAEKRGRSLLRLPKDALAAIGVDAATVKDVVITHLHWDHAGGMADFPAATFHLQDEEMSFATGRCMCHGIFRIPVDVDDVVHAVRQVFAGRVTFHDGRFGRPSTIAPGITLHLVGGHSGGMQIVRVPTARGWVVLASDAIHFYANKERGNPFPLVVDLAKMLDGYRICDELADGPDHVIPGHDPEVLARFPALPGVPDIVRVSDAPRVAHTGDAA
jgi:glyoxylase-like metal-dependent hydrolase (beta-lactamase superfamily II)